MANQKERRQLKLTDTLVDVQPVGVVYNITRQTIEDFVFDYLSNTKGIDKMDTVRADVRKTQVGWVIEIYGFILPSSSHVTSKSMQVQSIITQHMDSSSFKSSRQLQDALAKISKDTRLIKVGKGNNASLAFKLDTYKVLSLMLALDPYKHELNIPEVKPIKKGGFVATVIKQETFPKSEDSNDKYAEFMRSRR